MPIPARHNPISPVHNPLRRAQDTDEHQYGADPHTSFVDHGSIPSDPSPIPDDGRAHIWFNTGTNQWKVGIEGEAHIVAPGGMFSVIKDSDETVNNSSTFQADDELKFEVGANETWMFRFGVFVTGSATADFKARVVGPSGSTVHYATDGPTSTGTGGITRGQFSHPGGSGNSSPQHQVGAQGVMIEVWGIIKNGATEGDCELEWAQASATVADTVVEADSYLIAVKEGLSAAGGSGGGGGASDAADLTYTPAVLTDWDGDADPGNGDDALDQLAERVDDNEIELVSTIHDDVAGEIAALTEKASPVDDDLFLIEDSEASNAKKKVKKSSIGGGDVASDAIWDAAGDLAVGTGADTATRLAIGTGALMGTGSGSPSYDDSPSLSLLTLTGPPVGTAGILDIAPTATTSSVWTGIRISPTLTTTNTGGFNVFGVNGQAVLRGASGGSGYSVKGLQFVASPQVVAVSATFASSIGMQGSASASGIASGGDITVTEMIGGFGRLVYTGASGGTATVTDSYGFKTEYSGAGTLTNSYGFYADQPILATNRYGFYAEDISAGTIARLMELEDALIVKGSGEHTAANNESPLWLSMDAAQTSLQVTAGANDSGGSGFRVLRVANL